MKKRKLSATVAALMTLLVCLLLSGGGLAFYVTSVRPAEFHAQATTVAQDFATAQAQATYQENLRVSNQATATANFNHYLYLQTVNTRPALNDSLNLATDSYWQQSSTPDTTCGFIGGAYHAQSASRGQLSSCLLQANVFSDFALQVNMTLIKGDSGGIIFHVTGSGSSYDAYLFTVSIGGSYSLLLIHGSQLKILIQGYSQAINEASHTPNQIMVIAHGHTFLLFVNDQLIDSVSDNTFPSGAIGVFALQAVDPTDVAFNNAQVWQL